MGNVGIDKKKVESKEKTTMTNNYLSEMLKHVELIKTKQNEIVKLEINLETSKEELAIIDNDMMDDIISAIDETNGKPKFSNETKRNIALAELRLENAEYVEILNRIKKLKNSIAKINIEIEYSKNIFTAYKAQCYSNVNL